MSLIATTILSSPCNPQSLSPTDDLLLGIDRHRRYPYAYSTDA